MSWSELCTAGAVASQTDNQRFPLRAKLMLSAYSSPRCSCPCRMVLHVFNYFFLSCYCFRACAFSFLLSSLFSNIQIIIWALFVNKAATYVWCTVLHPTDLGTVYMTGWLHGFYIWNGFSFTLLSIPRPPVYKFTRWFSFLFLNSLQSDSSLMQLCCPPNNWSGDNGCIMIDPCTHHL